MIKKLTLIVTLMIATAGYAQSMMDVWKSAPDQLKGLQTWNTPQDCADFSGTWKGTCEFKVETIKVTQEVKQFGCFMIATDNQYHFIGGVKNQSDFLPKIEDTTESFLLNSTSSMAWNEDKSKIHNTMVINYHTLPNLAQSDQINVTSDMWLENGQLVSEFEVTPNQGKGSCRLDKVQ